MTLSEKIDYLFSKINWGTSTLDAKAISIINELKSDIKIEKAEQQLTGYIHKRNGYSIADLVSSMGLKESEYLYDNED